MTRGTNWMKLSAAAAVAALALTACGDGGGGNGDGEESGGSITLGIIPNWTDGLSLAYLWQGILEDQGYEVDIQEINEPAPLFTGVANGDIDVYPSAWPEITHAEYMARYEGDLEDLGAYYQEARLTLAVPEYTDIDSIEDLTGNADQFDGRIVGIEPGAGHMGVTENTVMPEYDLDGDYELVSSSTASMLTELGQAIDNEEDIVVTLWAPFWANEEYPVKELEDPKTALGESETLNFVANADFSEEFPEVAEWMGEFELDDEQYAELEDLMVNEYEDDEEEAAQVWMDENSDYIESITG